MTASDTPTPDQVRAEPAGLRLNRWVAELVMGQDVWEGGDYPCYRAPDSGQLEAASGIIHRVAGFEKINLPVIVVNRRALAEELGEEDFGVWLEPVPDYSGDMAAAWEVVECLKDQFCLLGRDRHCKYRHGPRREWDCVVYDDEFRDKVTGRGPTAQLAVCRAALLAVLGADPC